ncbi:transposase [Rhizohabitans arisaemae]|uniref:transposase n=1 Tax=Rhizohabitans arisaemae TaxID=2720610 RepID=UPI003D160A57
MATRSPRPAPAWPCSRTGSPPPPARSCTWTAASTRWEPDPAAERTALDLEVAAVDGSHIRALHIGPSPVDRGRPGAKHHLIVDVDGTPPAASVTGGDRHDVTQPSPAHPRSARPSRHLYADHGHDHPGGR